MTPDLDEFSSLVELLRFRAVSAPNRICFTFLVDGESEERSITFGELDIRARAIGRHLQDRGGKGKTALLLYPTGLEYICGFVGCLYAGVIAVPLFPPRLNRSLERIGAVAGNSNASFALTTPSILKGMTKKLEKETGLQGVEWVDIFEINDQLAEEWTEPESSDETLAVLQYTSGSTASPKGVQLSHGNILVNLKMLQTAWKTSKDSVIVSWLPLHHDMGIIGNMLHAIYAGCRCVLLSPNSVAQDPLRWLKAISKYRGTFSGGPNFMFNYVLEQANGQDQEDLDLSSWRIAYNGSEPVHEQTLKRFGEAFARNGISEGALYPVYGLAEATLFVTGSRPKGTTPLVLSLDKQALSQNIVKVISDMDSNRIGVLGCGEPAFGQSLLIVDPQTRRQVSPDRVGEVWISGENIASGYWENELETEKTFGGRLADAGAGPFLRTGDLGFMYAGQLFITGRIKDLVILQGNNHYPQDIELSTQQSHPALRAGFGVAFSIPVDGVEQLVIIQEVKRDYRKAKSFDEATSAIRSAVARDHGIRPYSIVLIRPNSLLKTSSGKVMRAPCRQQFLNGELSVINEWTIPSLD